MHTPSFSSNKKGKNAPNDLDKDKNATREQEEEHKEEVVDEAIEESFPASDPPSTSVPGTTVRPRTDQ